ncbi:MAG: glycogen synthase [Bryobacterales bacterium]|nr:glycogen synthase [Bryobacterales bacterium]
MQLRVLMVGSEVTPYAKTDIPAQVYAYEERGVRYFFLDAPGLFGRSGIYAENGQDYPDNFRRFAALSLAGCEAIRRLFRADILHCHDWQAGLAPLYLKDRYRLDPNFMAVRSVFTIHNLAYQGIFGREILPMVGLPDQAFLSGGVEFYGKVSYMKAGIARADAVTTVSPTYSKEIQTPAAGWGLDGLLRARKDVLHGILNGADYSLWDPAVDPYLAANYSAANLAGKALCKRDLLETVGLDATALENAPVVGIVARLSEQKGFDLVGAAADALMAEGIVLVVLGSGEARYVDLFRGLADRYPGRVAFRVGYNEALAHKIEAGADLFLMPSLYEPCGLNQIYSLRYGTVPVVRAVGGLDDTVTTETGFKFADYSGQALLESVREAVRAYRDKRNWKRRVLAGMAMDYSWTASAHQYAELYRRLRN